MLRTPASWLDARRGAARTWVAGTASTDHRVAAPAPAAALTPTIFGWYVNEPAG
jgi:hypothetical protein